MNGLALIQEYYAYTGAIQVAAENRKNLDATTTVTGAANRKVTFSVIDATRLLLADRILCKCITTLATSATAAVRTLAELGCGRAGPFIMPPRSDRPAEARNELDNRKEEGEQVRSYILVYDVIIMMVGRERRIPRPPHLKMKLIISPPTRTGRRPTMLMYRQWNISIEPNQSQGMAKDIL
jgi:predicted small lipoprotein YifL